MLRDLRRCPGRSGGWAWAWGSVNREGDGFAVLKDRLNGWGKKGPRPDRKYGPVEFFGHPV
jgi:hypothetical protein